MASNYPQPSDGITTAPAPSPDLNSVNEECLADKAAKHQGFGEKMRQEHGDCYTALHSRKKQPKDKPSAFRVTLEYLQILASHDMIKRSADYALFTELLHDSTIYIAVTGRHNVGKSTLINGLVGDDILPMNRKNESAVRVFIHHYEFRFTSGPELTLRRGENTIVIGAAKGKEAVCRYIRERNAEVRRSRTQDERLVLRLKMPKLKSESRFTVMLVDTPGFSEADQPHLEATANAVLRSSSAYLLLVSYHQLRDSVDHSILKQLTALDEGVIADGRLVVVVTQCDAYYDDCDETEMNREETIDYIHDSLRGLKLSRDRIIPVSGKWGLIARRLKKNPEDATILKAATRFLTSFKEATVCGQDHTSDSYMEVKAMNPVAIAEELEAASNIGALEFQIQSVTRRCDRVLEDNAISKIGGYLHEAISELRVKKKQKNDRFLDLREEKTGVRENLVEFQERKEKLLHTTDGRDLKVYRELLQKYKAEAEKPCHEVKNLICTMLDECNSSCLRKCNRARENPDKEQYSTEALNQEIVDFVDNQLADAIKPVVMRGCIYGTRQVWRLFILMYVPEEFKKMQQAVCNLPSVKPAIANAWNPPGMKIDTALQELDEDMVLGDLVKRHKLKVPDVIEWNWWDKLKAALRISFYCPQPGDPPTAREALKARGPDMDKIPVDDAEIHDKFHKLKKNFLERCDQYFFTDEGIQKTIVDCFHKEYIDWVKRGLDNFDTKFGPCIDREWKSIEVMEEEIKVLQEELTDIEYFIFKLEDLDKWFV